MSYVEKHKEIKHILRKLGGEAPDMIEHFGALHKSSTKDGAVPSKYRELIALGISIAIRCNECITYHMYDALNAGASDQEVIDTIEVAVMMGGGPALMYATHAYEAMHEIRAEQSIDMVNA